MINDGNESIDDWILNQWPKNGVRGFEQNKLSIEYPMIIERSGMEWNGMDVCRSIAKITIFWLEQD